MVKIFYFHTVIKNPPGTEAHCQHCRAFFSHEWTKEIKIMKRKWQKIPSFIPIVILEKDWPRSNLRFLSFSSSFICVFCVAPFFLLLLLLYVVRISVTFSLSFTKDTEETWLLWKCDGSVGPLEICWRCALTPSVCLASWFSSEPSLLLFWLLSNILVCKQNWEL